MFVIINTVSSLSCLESTSYVFPFRMVFFYLVTAGWIFTSAYVREFNQSNQSIKIYIYLIIELPPYYYRVGVQYFMNCAERISKRELYGNIEIAF